MNNKPFLKWAGGKKQLLPVFNKMIPSSIIDSKKIDNYVEPFVGGGAMFFNLKNSYRIKEAYLSDINIELVMAYQAIKNDHETLIDILKDLEINHLIMDEDGRKENYYRIRDIYNHKFQDMDHETYNDQWIERTAYLIFMNKTCFNGLYRENKKGEFNVPFGRYKKPTICDSENIQNVNYALKNVEIFCSDFTDSETYIDEKTFVYLIHPTGHLIKLQTSLPTQRMGSVMLIR